MTDVSTGALSPDGNYYWDGTRWVSSMSEDGWWRWNGVAWTAHLRPSAEPKVAAPYRPLRSLSVWLTVLIALSMLMAVIEAGVARLYYAETVSWGDLQVEYSVGIAGLVLLVPTAWIFLAWFARAHRNLPALGGTNLHFTPGWAVGWWFVPIACFWMPCLVALEIWNAGPIDSRRAGSSLLIFAWWATWLISIVMSNLVNLLVPPDRISVTLLELASGAATLAAGALAIWVVWSITGRQGRMIERA